MSHHPQRIGNYIDKAFAQNGIRQAIKRAEVVVLWPKVVKDVSKFSSAKSFKEGILLVEVSDNETATHLTLQRQHFLKSYRENFAVKGIKDIRFRVGVLEKTLQQQVSKNPIVIDEEELSKLTQQISQLNLSEDLTKIIFNLTQAYLRQKAQRKALGWQPCEICGVFKVPEENFCSHCQRLSTSHAVKDASQKLAVNPEAYLPYLNRDSLLVACYLAKQRLAEQMQELLPFILADTNNLRQLEQATHCYLAHHLNKPLKEITKNDYFHLPSNVARVLGYLG